MKVRKRAYKSLVRIIFIGLILPLLWSCGPNEITWVAIGDSITYLNDHPEQTGNRVTKGYMTRVVEKMPHVRYINQGHNGWTSGGIAENFDELKIEKGDIYTVFLGTNDWWQGRPIGEWFDYENNTGNNTVFGSFRIIIDKIKAIDSRAPIILMTPLQRGDFVYLADMHNNAYGSYRKKADQSLSQFADAILMIGEKEGINVVDLYNDSGITVENTVKYKRLRDPETGKYHNHSFPEYIDLPFDPDHDEYPYPEEAINMTYDALHPSDKGNEIIANLLEDEFRRL